MFSPLAMGTNHMLGVDQYTPLTQNNFEIRVYNMDGSTPLENMDLLTLSTKDIGNVSEDQDIITVHYANGLIKFPAKVTFPDVDWTLNCFCSPNVLGALREWRLKVFDPASEKMGLPSEYMKQAYIIRYDQQGNERDVLRLPGVWLKGIDYGGYAQDSTDLVQVKTTLVVSKVIPLSDLERS